jgi:glutathione S-transferase
MNSCRFERGARFSLAFGAKKGETTMAYELYYWPSIQGRGEFVRLALEDVGAQYVDIARLPKGEGAGTRALLQIMEGELAKRPPFAPPFLKAGKLIIGQTANILLYLGDHQRLAPESEAGRLWVHQLQLTLMDFVVEIHDTHHPISGNLYYDEQREEARRRAKEFRKSRVPKYLGYFEKVLARNPSGDTYLVGAQRSYADLSLFHVIAGLKYAFPRTMARLETEYPRIAALHDRVADRPRVRSYLASDRRIALNEEGIFRHYPELDG